EEGGDARRWERSRRPQLRQPFLLLRPDPPAVALQLGEGEPLGAVPPLPLGMHQHQFGKACAIRRRRREPAALPLG
ncbi:MAG: hypothetical protein WHU94_15755, partial [Thermogemmata sp.]